MQQHDRAVANFDRAIAICDDLLNLYSVPTVRVELLTQRGDAYNLKGDRDRAIADYDDPGKTATWRAALTPGHG
jgi:hypothetical protein